MIRRIVTCLLSLLLLFSLLPSARAEAVPDADWYEIFVRSFADSDGDGIGDLNGVRDKLDYVASLGVGGVWLMPVMPSPSYHKYDVTDYCAVDPEYGSLDELRLLLDEAHARGLRLILDLPVNHCSSLHPWFLSAAADPASPYRDYFNWSDEAADGYAPCGESWYECRFVDAMPDLNLDNPAVREEIREILRFWLEELGVDGFRLDAVTSYYTGRAADNIAFLNWLADTAHAVAPDCFLVAEAWEGLDAIARYAESRVDSFFCFPVSQSEGYIAKVLGRANRHPGRSYGDYTALLEQTLPADSIPAPFLENHDTGRTVGFTGRNDPDKTKMAFGLLALMRGDLFLYYGQEIGMVGSGEDPNKRIGMLWTSEAETTLPPPGTTKVEYAYPSVAEQESRHRPGPQRGAPLRIGRALPDPPELRGRGAAAHRQSLRLPCAAGSGAVRPRLRDPRRLPLHRSGAGRDPGAGGAAAASARPLDRRFHSLNYEAGKQAFIGGL